MRRHLPDLGKNWYADGYLSESEYVINAKLLEDGSAVATVRDLKSDIEWETTSHRLVLE